MPIACGVRHAFTCQTPLDECRTAADCAGEPGAYCGGEGEARECKINGAVCGRPYLVQGDARRAPCIAADDWCGAAIGCNTESRAADLTPELRRHVGEQWSEMGLLEHASIAAFARFTLRLLHAGAPCELVEQSQRAMLDERFHTQLCFGLASRYLGYRVGPGRLPMDAALDETDFAQIVVTTFREGCVGETVATLEARAAAEGATDPEVKSALERIAADELRHSELAWRFVRWALGFGGPALQGAVAAEVRRDVAQPVATRPTALAAPAHGILSGHDKQQARRVALAEVVLPCALALAASSERPSRSARLDVTS
jgi:hypothetical protein